MRLEMRDERESVAKYYDLDPRCPDDVPFYSERIRSPESRVLELGCGTGRVSIPLAAHCSFLHGVDHSGSMLTVCERKLKDAGLDDTRVQLTQGDISDLDLRTRFDLIIAPFRVIQNLETDVQLVGLFDSIRRNLATSGRCILNVFRPSLDRADMLAKWASPEERLAWEVETGAGRVACFDHWASVTENPLVVHPRLIYRRYEGDAVVDEVVLEIATRCFYPDELVERIESAGFSVTKTWGGYAGEPYGIGSELVVEFTMDA